ncbi:MAG TPA: FGGY-family carbohydrate kinase [Polyangiales bacterium]
MSDAFLGVDVGTGSVRAALFDAQGARLGMGVSPIQLFQPRPEFVEQSSVQIWAACAAATRQALGESGLAPDAVKGIGFDATCSLVVLDAAGRPVGVRPDADDAQNVIVWMDHRAVEQAERINRGDHHVLRYVGGSISPEMETPKLLWLKENAPHAFARAAHFFDLPDYLTYRATGEATRSLCSTVCKWTYLGKEQRWDDAYFRAIGLGVLADEGFARIGTRVRPMGERIAGLSESAARELGLLPGTPVGVSIIDAHAGGLGLLGADLGGALDFDRRLALIGGTSSCHMAVSADPRFIDGVWGPYYSAMVPGLWLTEGGQSATGALIDHVVNSHSASAALRQRAEQERTTVYALLNAELTRMGRDLPFLDALTAELHVMPDFHGNRSPRADPSLRGMISGLRLFAGVEELALVYLATLQAIAHGTRHIIDALNARGYHIDTLIACGGDVKNPLFVRTHADVTGCRVALPEEPEAVLLGASMLGAAASGAVPDLQTAMVQMNRVARVVEPGAPEVRGFHQRKHAVFQRMHADQLAYRALMRG